MKRVLYTQRVEVVACYGERRDCADQRIPRFIRACDYLPVPLPNVPDIATQLLDDLAPAGLVLTGGNDLGRYGGNMPERDETEARLLQVAFERGVPVFAFCHGMQVIIDHFGGKLVGVVSHVASRHEVSGEISREVNSYHNMAAMEAPAPLRVIARSQDGVVEAVACGMPKLTAIMWHPEREERFLAQDIEMLKALFK